MRWVVFLVLTACVSMGPADYRPDQVVMIMRACQAMCSKSGGAGGYTITDGECICRASRRGE